MKYNRKQIMGRTGWPASFAIGSFMLLILSAPSLVAQTSEPALEPIPMPAPLAKSDSIPADGERQAEEIRADDRSTPTPLEVRPASNQEPIPTEGSFYYPDDEIIVDSPTIERQPAAVPPQSGDRPFSLNTADGVVIEHSTPTRPPMANPADVVVPSRPSEMTRVPADPNVIASPSGPIVTRRTTTLRSYYVTPSGRVYVPQQSTSTYQQAYYAPRVEYPVGSQVTVYRNPYSRVTAVNITAAAPPGYGYGPVPVVPAGFSLVIDPGAMAPVGPPPPMVPGQPVRNAIRAWAW